MRWDGDFARKYMYIHFNCLRFKDFVSEIIEEENDRNLGVSWIDPPGLLAAHLGTVFWACLAVALELVSRSLVYHQAVHFGHHICNHSEAPQEAAGPLQHTFNLFKFLYQTELSQGMPFPSWSSSCNVDTYGNGPCCNHEIIFINFLSIFDDGPQTWCSQVAHCWQPTSSLIPSGITKPIWPPDSFPVSD